ncbi:MAG: phosphodiester glycosidase family protein [Chitinivibrionales bacterium]|nr:phosphodiester glycosidase family protein [Chitinivibrionales bacterium]
MNPVCRSPFLILLTIGLTTVSAVGAEQTSLEAWESISTGLSLAKFSVDETESALGDNGRIIILRIDPHHYTFKLLSAKEKKLKEGIPLDQWCKKYGLIAAVNAGMYQTDYLSNVGYMKNYSHKNNPRVHPKYYSVFACNPVSGKTAFAAVFDTDLTPINEVIKKYHTVVQNLRLIKKPRENKWPPNTGIWSEVALGQDSKGNILFIFCRTPLSMHQFNTILLRLPINIVNAQHLEGGPQASFYLKYKTKSYATSGGLGIDLPHAQPSVDFLPLPNVIGILKK